MQLEEGIPDLRRCRRCCQASQGSVRPQLPTTPQASNMPSQGREAGGRRGVCGQELAPVFAPCSGHCSHFLGLQPAGLHHHPCFPLGGWTGLPAMPLSCNLSFDNPALELPRFPPCPLPRARVTGSKNKRQQRGHGAGLGSNVCRRWGPACSRRKIKDRCAINSLPELLPGA